MQTTLKEQFFLGRLLDAMPVGIWILNAAGEIEVANKAAIQIWNGARFGNEAPEAYKGWWVRNGQPISPEDWAAKRALLKGEVSLDEEVEIESFNGIHKFILNSAVPLDEEGCRRVLVVNQDITARKHRETELLQEKEKLQQEVSELARHNEETSRKLRETLDTLEGVLYHLAHDLRAPLRAIEGFSSSLSHTTGEAGEPPTMEYLERVAKAARWLERLIHDLLEYGGLGHDNFALSIVNLESVLECCINKLWPEIVAHKAVVRVMRPLPAVWGNQALFENIFCPLLHNAFKFAQPDVPPEIKIRWEQTESCVCILIEDKGIGIPPENQEKVFRIFETLPANLGCNGTGIGLAIVRKAARRLGGKIKIDSRPGQGTSFRLELPLNPSAPLL